MNNIKLYNKLIEASKMINKSRRGKGDYIIINPEIAKEIDSENKMRNKKINQILK